MRLDTLNKYFLSKNKKTIWFEKTKKPIWALEFDCHLRYVEIEGRNILSFTQGVNDFITRNTQPDVFSIHLL